MSTSFDRHAIMTKAWAGYRYQTAWSRPGFQRSTFARCLADAWAEAKAERAIAADEAAEAARLAVASPTERRLAEIKSELVAMQYRDFIPWQRHDALTAELAQLRH